MKKKSLVHTSLFCALLFLLSFAGCKIAAPPLTSEHFGIITDIPSPTPTFEEFTNAIFVKEITSDTISLRYHLSQPENYGIADYPITLGSVQDSVAPDESVDDLYAQLLTYNPDDFYEEERLTYLSLKHHLNLMLQDNFSPYLSELLGPTTGYQAQLPLVLAEYRFETVEDVTHYLELLPCVYDYFKELAEFEKAKSAAGYFMNDETAKEIIAQCKEFVGNPDNNFLISTFEERLAALPLTASEKTELILSNQSALYNYIFPAYELLADALTECLGTCKNEFGLCYYENGKDYYELFVRLNTGSEKSMTELKECLLSAITSGCNAMALALEKEPALYDNALSPDYPETNPENIISFIEKKSKEHFPAVDCTGYKIKYIPESLQDYVSPAMYLIPPLDRYNDGVIYINKNPLYEESALFPTIAHEGYPGHLYQTVSVLSGNIHPLRYLLSSNGYEEGWATYVETYCYKYAGFSDSLTTFLQADQIATLCLYALSDLFIHYDGYTKEQLSTFLTAYGFPEESAPLIFQTLLAEPGAYLPYAVGCLEFIELKNKATELWKNDYSDYRFHEFLLETGPMPFALLSEELEKTLGN